MTARRVSITPRFGQSEVEEAIAAIKACELVVLPTETVYGLVADPASPESIEQTRSFKRRSEQLVFTHHIADTADVEKFVPPPPARIQRLYHRYWPGPLTLILPDAEGRGVGLRLPAHDFTRAVIRGCGPSLYMSSVNHSGEPPLIRPDDIEAEFGARLDLICDAGPPPLEQASTVVRFDGDELSILREGTLSAEEILYTAARRTLFVCTGNTCRSPLAEALARRETAARLGISEDRLLARGFSFASAGTAGGDGSPASDGSLAVGMEAGLDLSAHRSQPLTPALIAAADRVLCMGQSHLMAAVAMAPDRVDHIDLLQPDGADIPDPFGHSVARYRGTRDAIHKAIEARLPALLAD